MAEGYQDNPYAIFSFDVLGQVGYPSNIVCYRCGNIVYLTCVNGMFTSQGMYNPLIYSDANIVVPSLPVGYRPINTAQASDAYSKKRIAIDGSGVIMSSDSFTGTFIRFSATWVTSDPMPNS